MKQYVKKQIPVEAIQYIPENISEIMETFGENNFYFGYSFMTRIRIMWFVINLYIFNKLSYGHLTESIKSSKLYIKTLEGNMLCNIGDYILHGPYNDIWTVKKEIFEKTYELYIPERNKI